jgi:hypothetical protein
MFQTFSKRRIFFCGGLHKYIEICGYSFCPLKNKTHIPDRLKFRLFVICDRRETVHAVLKINFKSNLGFEVFAACELSKTATFNKLTKFGAGRFKTSSKRQEWPLPSLHQCDRIFFADYTIQKYKRIGTLLISASYSALLIFFLVLFLVNS